MWRSIVRQGMSVVALVVNPDPDAKPLIAGANLLQVVTAEDEADPQSNIQVFRSALDDNCITHFYLLYQCRRDRSR